MKVDKETVEDARKICRHVLPIQIVQGKYPEEVCLTDSVYPGRSIIGKVIKIRCAIKLGFLNETCVIEDPDAECRAGGATETQMKNLGLNMELR